MDSQVRNEKINRLEGMVGQLTLIWNQYLELSGGARVDTVFPLQSLDPNFSENERLSYLENMVVKLTVQCNQFLESRSVEPIFESSQISEGLASQSESGYNDTVNHSQLGEQDLLKDTVTSDVSGENVQTQFRPQTLLTIMRHFTFFVSRHSLLSSNENLELIGLFRKYVETKGRIHKDRLDFYFACEGLKQQKDSTVILRVALSIYRFLLKSKIRVTEGIRRAINNLLRTESVDTNVFDLTQEVVGNVIYATTYKSFLDTEMYSDFMDRSSEVSLVLNPISFVTEPEVEFDVSLKVCLYRRFKFLVSYCGNVICAENCRCVTVNYIRDRHMEWEIAWKKNFDLF